jgi:GH25 family lysozyme M1 (1,4-beta-N-acetylmuramidase)
MKSHLRNTITKVAGTVAPISHVYPEPGRVVALDVHQYSGVIKDWARLKENAAAILIKLTDGRKISRFGLANWEGARKAGILRGSWGWLYRARDISVNAQARKAAQVLKEDPGELPFFVDYEWTRFNFRRSDPNISDLWSFLHVFEAETGRVPGIYTAPGYWSQYGTANQLYARHPLWLANYDPRPVVPLPWAPNNWMFWQFTESGFGEDYGVDKYQERAVDLSYYNGTLEELRGYGS